MEATDFKNQNWNDFKGPTAGKCFHTQPDFLFRENYQLQAQGRLGL